MAYVTQERNRAATLAAVGALHAAAIYALVTGLAGPVWKVVTDTRTAATNIPIPQVPTDPIEQPTTKPTVTPAGSLDDKASDDSAITVVTTAFPTTGGESTSPVGGSGVGTGEGSGTVIDPYVPPAADPVLPPKLARPIGKPGLWVTPNDYPAIALRMGHEGVTRFQLGIGTDGKVQSCEVTVSSGHAALDNAACANLRKRGKFVAATGPNGSAVPGTYSSAVRWTLPKDY
jgi:protein TonB